MHPLPFLSGPGCPCLQSEAGQGAVIAKAFEPTAAAASSVWNGTVDVWNLSNELKKGSFYVLETNYDRTTAPPGFDDRRYPAENCLEKTIGTLTHTAATLSPPFSGSRPIDRQLSSHRRQLLSCPHDECPSTVRTT